MVKNLYQTFLILPGSYSTIKLEKGQQRGKMFLFREPQTELEALLNSFGVKVSNKSISTLGASQRLEYERQVRSTKK